MRLKPIFTFLLAVMLLPTLMLGLARSAQATEVTVGVLRIDYPHLASISRFERDSDDLGFAGAKLGNEDNQTTGQFLGHTYKLITKAVPPQEAEAALDELQAQGVSLFVILANEDDLLRLADKAGDQALVFNATATATRLRSADCRANILHIAPSNAMLADAVAQFAVWKKWREWLLVSGSNPADQALSEAYRKAARKFGAKIVEERLVQDTGGTRRTDTGHVLVQRQIPVLTQDTEDHDVVVVADASDVFAPYLPFHLWTPRPTLGSAGLRPVAFDSTNEAWGAEQFQNRFEADAKRSMREEDYTTWLALRVLGEAVSRTGSASPKTLEKYILSDAFDLAAFKGQKVTFRNWNGQLRQPVLLVDGRITVSVSPQEGFLHQTSPLDTLGLDKPESQCHAF